jgi:DNA sulfur modification protein DndC
MMRNGHRLYRAAKRIAAKYNGSGSEWVLAFSGGKDSTAVLLSTIAALQGSPQKNIKITAVFCNTGVENPYVAKFVEVAFHRIEHLRKSEGLPIYSAVVHPLLQNTFWVKVIGRGCPPPTNRFRWCTDKLRVNPIRDFVRARGLVEALTVTGIREKESQQRSRTTEKYATDDRWILRYYDAVGRRYFCPILDFTAEEVWELLEHKSLGDPEWLYHLQRIYGPNFKLNGAVGEFRTGCWTCTVVRRDRAAEQLAKRGHMVFHHLKDFRDWLAVFRDDREYRCRKRRNGTAGPGAITIEGREIILTRLMNLQKKLVLELITEVELNEIQRLWVLDRACPKYAMTI